MNSTALVFGARGQIGRFLLPLLPPAGWVAHAVTRSTPPSAWPADVQWHQRDLYSGADLDVGADTVFSLGPLDGFASWFERSALRPARVIAFSSTSADSKQSSPDPRERALAERLVHAESRLLTTCRERGTRATLLRPTLVYGAGLDRNLTRIAQIARRWRFFVLPRGATGLRQPVHAQDLADAAWRAAQVDLGRDSIYELPGAETLPYREMVRRVLACLEPPVRLYEVPSGLLQAGLRLARRSGAFDDAGAGVIARLKRDLVFDGAPAMCDLGYAPRAFHPHAGLFVSPETE
jgi:nucleoside-diphosphate-sugar epimerase